MKYLLILAIIAVSMCVGLPIDLPSDLLPFGQQSGTVSGQDPYIQLDVEIIPKEVRPGRTLTLIFQATNNNDFDLTGVTVKAYDTCIFDDNGQTEETFNLKPLQTEIWEWEWDTPTEEIRIEKNCEIKIKAEYTALFSLYQDIVVLSRSEYRAREMQGTLHNIPIQKSASKAPLSITLTFPENQPLMEGTSGYSMFIDYYNVGDGFVTVEKEEISINMPENTGGLNCGDYFTSGEANLRFINNKAQRTTCYFDAGSMSSPVDIRQLSIKTNYKYTIDESVFVAVKL
jgi:hypothetical protein